MTTPSYTGCAGACTNHWSCTGYYQPQCHVSYLLLALHAIYRIESERAIRSHDHLLAPCSSRAQPKPACYTASLHDTRARCCGRVPSVTGRMHTDACSSSSLGSSGRTGVAPHHRIRHATTHTAAGRTAGHREYPIGTPIDTETHAHTHGGERTAQRHTDGSIVTHVGQLCGRSPGTVRLSRAPSAIAPARHNALSRVYVQQRGKRCCVDPQGKALPY